MAGNKPDFTKSWKRSFEIRADDLDKESREIWIAASSDSPVERMYGYEILDHNPASIVLDRLRSDGALLWNHNTNMQVGAITDARIESGKIRVKVKFSRSQLGLEKMQDVEDGILRSVSIGYRVHDAKLEKTDEKNGDTYRITRWEPNEVSFVTVPADTSAGVGRSAETPTNKPIITMSEENNSPAKVDANQVRSEAIKQERERSMKIDALLTSVSERGYQIPADAKRKADENNWTADQVAAYCMESLPKAQREADRDVVNQLQRSERRTFQIGNCLRSLVSNRPIEGFEREVIEEYSKRTGHRSDGGGLLIPFEVFRQRSLLAGQYDAGGSFIPVQQGDLIAKLDPDPVVVQAGGRMLTGLSSPVSFPRQTGAAVAQWLAEGAEVSKSTPATDDVVLSPKRLTSFVEASRQFVLGSSIDAEGWIRSEILKRIYLAIDLAALTGSGTSGVPKGLFSLNTSTSGINTVAFGGAPTWAKVTEFEGEVEDSDGLAGSLAWITSSPVKAKWKATSKDSGSGQYLADGNEANGYSIYTTSQLAGTAFADRVAFGNWNQCMIAMFGAIELLTDQSAALHNRGMIGITGLTHADVAIAQPASFAVSTDKGNQ